MPVRPAPSASTGRTPAGLLSRPSAARRSFARAPLAFALRLCLALALVLVQGAALTHVISHTAEVSAARSGERARFDTDDGARHLAYCVDCLSFGGIDLPLADRDKPPVASGAALAPAAFRSVDSPACDDLAPRCRAPPAAIPRAWAPSPFHLS
ncbi:hypothetical protein AzCIB_0413 [Azoarcus sp. CIB]|uniref:hypothetical protein n=1 Tax=Aromatoleum sp. (strain CIB) TaxID=198107 RepID=UPI00067B76F4|nr:hypothetical protein [Azoarcus sp. CIB]AKU10318.1 hypothetical protein AzCIB_0413 [Azoarcus sp. CIB]